MNPIGISRFSPPILDILRDGGWYENRNVTDNLSLSSQLNLFPAAQCILAEFGGLCFGSSGAGIECAKSKLQIDSFIEIWTVPELQKFACLLKTELIPIGELDDGDEYLIVDEKGRIYVQSLVSLELVPIASTFSQCLELILLGKKLSPQQIKATWPETTISGSRAPYKIVYTKWGIANFRQNTDDKNEDGK
jgi:hypothetical protein